MGSMEGLEPPRGFDLVRGREGGHRLCLEVDYIDQLGSREGVSEKEDEGEGEEKEETQNDGSSFGR